MPEVSTEDRLRVQRLATEVAVFWGQGFAVAFDGDCPSFSWDEVHIPKKTLAEGDEALKCLLLHEWGHRCIAPRTVAKGFLWELLARMEGITDSASAANTASDLMVDRWYMRHPTTGPGYTQNERRSTQDILAKPEAMVASVAHEPTAFLYACYSHLCQIEPSLAGVLKQMPRAQRALDLLFNNDQPEVARMRSFFNACAPIFKEQEKRKRQPSKGVGIGSVRSLEPGRVPWRGVSWNADQLVRLIQSGGLKVPQSLIEKTCGEKIARIITGRLSVLESLARIDSRVDRFLSPNQSSSHSDFVQWRVGEPIRSLEALASIERSAMLLPGITTLKRKPTATQIPRDTLPSVCIVMDDSASTRGQILRHELDAAIALLEASRRSGTQASAVIFGSRVTAEVPPGFDHDRISLLFGSLQGGSGGTSLAPALAKATEYLPSKTESMATVIFTDSYIFDVMESGPHLRKLRSRGPVLIFCVADTVDEELQMEIEDMDPSPTLIRFRPGQQLVDQALEVLR